MFSLLLSLMFLKETDLHCPFCTKGGIVVSKRPWLCNGKKNMHCYVFYGGKVDITGRCIADAFDDVIPDFLILSSPPQPQAVLYKGCNCRTGCKGYLKSGQIKITLLFHSYKLVLRCLILFVCSFMQLIVLLGNKHPCITAYSKFTSSSFISW